MSQVIHGVGETAALDLAGVGPTAELAGVEVTRIDHRDLGALVSHADGDEVLPSRANLLAHTRVLEAVAETATVVPMRFGVVVPDAEALVADYLEPEHDALLATIARLDGHLEMRLRGRYEEAEVLREVLADDKRAARLRGREDLDAKMELGERVVAGIEARRERDAARAARGLDQHVAAASAGAVGEQLDAFVWSFLVARDDREAFEQAVDDLAGELAPTISLELVGPLPPFSFADGGAAG